MAIKIDREINIISEQQFYKIDYHITGLAYEIHNKLGRLWSEEIYKHELANRCRAVGYENVEVEKAIIVSHKDFHKKYFIDLFIANSMIYELKAVSELTSEHEKQMLNYLFLTGLQHGKLLNFRPLSVQKRFVSTTLRMQDRYNFFIYESALKTKNIHRCHCERSLRSEAISRCNNKIR
ncbi:GxxExxY protein, partial [candidate division KSB1 bacterium]|nr:GxxExxY protein [candidate division KSB1 bacterium]